MAGFAGVVLIDKERGYTSHDVVAICRGLFGGKAGHTGTLDPGATGLLPVCLGGATKFSGHFSSAKKSYVAEILLGVETDTGDSTGDVPGAEPQPRKKGAENPVVREISLAAGISPARDYIERALAGFLGESMQMPPMYSAVKIGGKKLYELAREGLTVEREPRPVRIYGIRLLEQFRGRFTFSVDCSKGTYVRALCEDIGKALGAKATMGDLRRTRSGAFSVEDAATTGRIKASGNRWADFVIPIEKLIDYPRGEINQPGAVRSALCGQPVKITNVDGFEPGAEKHWLSAGGRTIGLYVPDGAGRLVRETTI